MNGYGGTFGNLAKRAVSIHLGVRFISQGTNSCESGSHSLQALKSLTLENLAACAACKEAFHGYLRSLDGQRKPNLSTANAEL